MLLKLGLCPQVFPETVAVVVIGPNVVLQLAAVAILALKQLPKASNAEIEASFMASPDVVFTPSN